MRFAFIAKQRHIWPVSCLCEAPEVSRSGFHAWLSRPPGTRVIHDAKLVAAIRTSFKASDRTCGVRWRRGKADTLLHHSDQGSQYTSEQFQRLLADNGITCPMSRAGNVRDNPAMESFFSTQKTERTASKVCRTRNEARAHGFDDIERF
ncbi:Integrase core domain protein [Pseudogemmobacter humi]|uniref:Integrase core domain protein n=1 Tax=Pseudogemmobacter humi TaxID=2483812 RepID=A0A3P5WJ81_9RHOB|nr:Integrase core domain protein [Pseudogemmobacter humi]